MEIRLVRGNLKGFSALGLCLSAVLLLVASAKADDQYNYRPEGGYVSRRETAIAIGEVILKSIYGKRMIDAEKPLKATLSPDGVWLIEGSGRLIPGILQKGGVAEIWISKSDGRILRVLHGE